MQYLIILIYIKYKTIYFWIKNISNKINSYKIKKKYRSKDAIDPKEIRKLLTASDASKFPKDQVCDPKLLFEKLYEIVKDKHFTKLKH